MRSLSIAGMCLALVACGAEPAGPSQEQYEEELLGSLAQQVESSGVVQRQADGEWISTYTYEPLPEGGHRLVTLHSIWVDAEVQNLAYDKTFGLVWTVDDWQTANVSYGWYEASLGDGLERWGIDVGEWDSYYYDTFEYAVFCTMDGQTYWDNNDSNNYQISL